MKFCFLPLIGLTLCFTPNYSIRKIKVTAAKSRQGTLSSRRKGMFQYVTGIYAKVIESHTKWNYEKLIKATRGMEWLKGDKFWKEMAKMRSFTTFTPGWSNRANRVKWRNLAKTEYFFISFPKVEVTS